MKKQLLYILLFSLLIVIVSGCSTKKNTWASRAYQSTNTRFNVYFNGYVSYNEGLHNILRANKEDFSSVIPMYPISHHSNASAATTEMDRTIEKCRKAIKLHSIKVKPKKDYRKANSPEYKLFYNQEEFNDALKEAWLLLAKAEFHKADFLGSVGTFSYILRHYSSDQDLVAVCQLWITRAYAEMGWLYEAEEVLSKLVQDNLKPSNVGLFASVNADLLLKKHQYKEAIPFLEIALEKEKDKDMEQRFGFLLAQLYHKTGDDKAAFEAYSNVIKLNPTYQMDFNARIARAQLNTENIVKVRKELQGMLLNSNNKEYLDQLYFVLGNTYLAYGDTVRAINNYRLSADTSSRKGIDKALTLITLGDIYYQKKNYVTAQPCYDEASKILTNEHDDYARILKRAETLSELVVQNDIVTLQDSLQKLSALSETEKLRIVEKIIAKLVSDEKLAADKALKDNAARNRNIIDENELAMTPPIGMNTMGGWYFYNPDILRNGQTEFNKKWGKRKLEDNWRRTNKATSLFADENINNAPATASTTDSVATATKTMDVTDSKKPEFYLNQIPTTPAQMAKSNAEIATALFAMGEIYKEKVEDLQMAISTFDEFIRRFGLDKRVPDAYYNLYMIQNKLANKAEAERFRNKLITDYPGSKYHKILSQPDYAQHLERMNFEQDSIYTLAYKAYNASDFETVFGHVAYMQKNFPLAPLMPKFLFLNALSIGKKDTQEKFKEALITLVTNYPASDVSAMAKDILALMKQGQEAKTGTTSGTLLTRRDEITKTEIVDIAKLKFSTDKLSRHRLLLVSTAKLEDFQKLQYQVASFNFSRFMIKDFDLVINKIDTARNALSVTNFESFDEVSWYVNSLNSDTTLARYCTNFKVKQIIISDENFGLLKNTYSLDDYLAFLVAPVEKKPKVLAIEAKQIKSVEPQLVVQNNTVAKPIEPVKTKLGDKPIEKLVEKPNEKLVAIADSKPTDKKPAEIKTVVQPAEKVAAAVQPSKPELAVKPVVVPAVQVAVQTKPDDTPLFKGLFAYKANEAHYVALYVLSGTVDFEKTKAAFDAYNAANYSVMNLKVTLERFDKLQVIIVGSLTDAAVAKSYLLRMVKEKVLFEGLKGANYRNLLGSQKNLNTVMQQNALNTYFEFMQEYYLK